MEDAGILVLATNDYEYRSAVGLAYSIRVAGCNLPVTVVKPPEMKFPERDPVNIVDLPFGFKGERRASDWQLYWVTPYTYNLVMDCYTLVRRDLSSVMDYLYTHHDIAYPVRSYNFKGVPMRPDEFDWFTELGLENLYSDMFYFTKNSDTLEYFQLMDIYQQNWQDVIKTFVPAHQIPDHYMGNLIHSLCATHMTMGEQVRPLHKDVFSYTNMQSSDAEAAIWTNLINVWPGENAKLKIQNYTIDSVLYYRYPEFLTEEIFNEQYNTYSRL